MGGCRDRDSHSHPQNSALGVGKFFVTPVVAALDDELLRRLDAVYFDEYDVIGEDLPVRR